MKIQITKLFKVVEADEGMLLHNEDTYSKVIYMPFDGDVSVWDEVTEESAEEQNMTEPPMF